MKAGEAYTSRAKISLHILADCMFAFRGHFAFSVPAKRLQMAIGPSAFTAMTAPPEATYQSVPGLGSCTWCCRL
eukprot:COSAG03_NODE_1435_length_4080_cov_9.709261_3_plen_74_part_00